MLVKREYLRTAFPNMSLNNYQVLKSVIQEHLPLILANLTLSKQADCTELAGQLPAGLLEKEYLFLRPG
jgi:hypothetical protein